MGAVRWDAAKAIPGCEDCVKNMASAVRHPLAKKAAFQDRWGEPAVILFVRRYFAT